MYKALVVDDEKPVRQVIKALGMWVEFGIETIYEAVEGGSALKVMRENYPEIVFVDMKMPNMNGMEFLLVARKEFPKSKYIVISGYDDFEFTKQAIHSKVLDYLLKPVIESELNEVISRAVSELNGEMEQQMKTLGRNIAYNIFAPMANERIVTLIIESDGKISLPKEYGKILGIEESGLYFGIAILSIINLDKICIDRFDKDMHSTVFAITNVINEMFSEWKASFSFRNSRMRNEILLVLAVPNSPTDDIQAQVYQKIKETIKELENLFGIFCIASIGELYSEFERLNDSYKIAAKILNSINVLHCSDTVFTKCEMKSDIKRVSIMDKKEILIYALESGSIDYTKNIIQEYFENIREQGSFTIENLYKTAMEFIVIMESILERLEIPQGGNIISVCRDNNPIISFTKLEEFSEFVFSVMEKIYTSVRMNLKADENANLYEIKNYIDKNYFKEIKLSIFSDQYYISKEYLSKQFKNIFGHGIYEYVLKVRMERAREMVCDPSIKIHSISEHLGYKDNNYFSRAFKVYYGRSPSEYRDMNKTK